jgi:DNA-binding transcriptional MerR regulator
MFTVKQLSRLAGVTPRTLHYYDQIGLLKPTQLGENGYRYYGDESLLRLQQILIYRELDLPLEQIKKILDRRDFDVLNALEGHREQLQDRIRRLERVVSTVNHTITYLRGETIMNQKQLFEPFNEEQQAEYEKEAMQMYDPAIVKASNKKWKNYTPAEKQRIADEGNAVYLGFLQAMPLGAASPEAQACVERWRRHMDYFWMPNEAQLLGLAEGYNSDPRFKANFDKIDPDLAGFVLDAVKIYVKK